MTIKSDLEELREMLKERLSEFEEKLEMVQLVALGGASAATIAAINQDSITEEWLRLKAPGVWFECSYGYVQIRKPNLPAKEAREVMRDGAAKLQPWLDQLAEFGLVMEMTTRDY